MRDARNASGAIAQLVAASRRAGVLLWVLVRVALFVGAGLSLFLVAFLGYFTLPFFFLGAALVVLAAGRAVQLLQRFRARTPR